MIQSFQHPNNVQPAFFGKNKLLCSWKFWAAGLLCWSITSLISKLFDFLICCFSNWSKKLIKSISNSFIIITVNPYTYRFLWDTQSYNKIVSHIALVSFEFCDTHSWMKFLWAISVALAFLLIYNFNSQTRQQDHLFASLTSANDLLFSLGHIN